MQEFLCGIVVIPTAPGWIL